MDGTNFWQHELFSELTQAQRHWLSDKVDLRQIESKSPVFQHTDPTSHLYIINEGTVLVEVFSESNKGFITHLFGKDDIFGLEGLAGQKEWQSQARTIRKPAQIIAIPYAAIRVLMESDFDFSTKILSYISQRTQQVEKRIYAMTNCSALQRFACFVASKTIRFGYHDGECWNWNSQLTQEEIGAYIGTGRQTVTEILNELKSKNILSYHWGRFKVLKLDELKK